MAFYTFFGWLIFWVSLITAIVLFTIYKRIYPVFYLSSVALYIFTTSFIISVFEFGRVAILTTFIVSAVIFIFAGNYLSKVLHVPKKKRK